MDVSISTATRERPGTASLRISSRLASSSPLFIDRPVTLPPGCARLAMTPLATGSAMMANTIGMRTPAACRARIGCDPAVTITAASLAANRAQISRRRSAFASA